MGRACLVCTHPQRTALDAALIRGESTPRLAEQFRTKDDSLLYHKEHHLPSYLVKAAEAEDVRHAIDHIAQFKAINAATAALLEEGLRTGDHKLTFRAIDRLYKQIELQAKLIGELDERPALNLNLHPEWILIRTTLISALSPYPEAAAAVAKKLLTLESPTANGQANGTSDQPH